MFLALKIIIFIILCFLIIMIGLSQRFVANDVIFLKQLNYVGILLLIIRQLNAVYS